MRRGGHFADRVSLAIAAAVVLTFAALPAAAQYFGRNKVLWEDFDFEVVETTHFDIYHYPPDAESVEYIARLAERWYARLAEILDHDFEERKPLIVYRDHADFQQTVITSGIISEGTGGFTESLQDRIVLPLTGINADNDHVIGHELVHAFQFDIIDRQRSEGTESRSRGLPLWVVEGMAEYLSQGREDVVTSMILRDAVLHENLPDPDAFITRQLSPYHYGQAVWAYIAGRWDDDAVQRFFRASVAAGPDEAIDTVLGVDAETFWREFHEALRVAYEPVLEARIESEAVAEPLLVPRTTDAEINLAPSLSPDGERIAFLSSRALAIELYLADARTGEVIDRLVGAETDPHFDNLSFLDSSAAWSPDGRLLAFSVFAEGERRIAIYDVDKRRVVRRLGPAGVKGMRHPTWSPDGASIVFSAVTGRASDLFSVDIETGEVRQLTDDGYTAIQPTFSPDGETIAFVTDRGPATDLELLRFGPLGIALLDLVSGDIRTLSIFERSAEVDPQFAPDGSEIWFVGEPDGVRDLYRYNLENGSVLRATQLKTGVTGITDTAPAISVSSSGVTAFSVLEDSSWNIYRATGFDGERIEAEPGLRVGAGVLPPAVAPSEVVTDYLDEPRIGLPSADRDFPGRSYDSKLRFRGFGPASIGVGSSRDGGAFGGGLSAIFNDPLNYQQLVTSFQGGSTGGDLVDFEDSIGVSTTYLNQANRFQWGARGARRPYTRMGTAYARVPFETDDGTTVQADVVQRTAQVVTVEEAGLFARYPLSRNNRFELGAELSRIGFENEIEQLIFPAGGEPIRRRFSPAAPEALDLRSGSAAFVRDTSRFGITSPVSGARFRAELSYTRGDLSYRTLTLDYRKYFFGNPLTYALRVMHLGRRGADAGDPRLPFLDVGRSTLVHGYELDSIGSRECTFELNGISQICPELDRLVGSRIGVVNFEVRLPLLGTEELGFFEGPVAPTELAFFVDVGAAWSEGQSVELDFQRNTTERVPVVSSGIAVRTVLLGSLPLEAYVAWPHQRPAEDRVFGFMLNVAW